MTHFITKWALHNISIDLFGPPESKLGIDSGTQLSDCPFAPGTDDWKAWQREFIEFQRYYHGADAIERADGRIRAAGLRLGGEWAPQRELSPEDRIIRDAEVEGEAEVAAVRRARWDRIGTEMGIDNIAPRRATVTPVTAVWNHNPANYSFVIDTNGVLQDLTQAVRNISITFQMPPGQVKDAFQSILGSYRVSSSGYTRGGPIGITWPGPETHTIRGLPAGRVHTCRHGNPKGTCRDCSMQRP